MYSNEFKSTSRENKSKEKKELDKEFDELNNMLDNFLIRPSKRATRASRYRSSQNLNMISKEFREEYLDDILQSRPNYVNPSSKEEPKKGDPSNGFESALFFPCSVQLENSPENQRILKKTIPRKNIRSDKNINKIFLYNCLSKDLLNMLDSSSPEKPKQIIPVKKRTSGVNLQSDKIKDSKDFKEDLINDKNDNKYKKKLMDPAQQKIKEVNEDKIQESDEESSLQNNESDTELKFDYDKFIMNSKNFQPKDKVLSQSSVSNVKDTSNNNISHYRSYYYYVSSTSPPVNRRSLMSANSMSNFNHINREEFYKSDSSNKFIFKDNQNSYDVFSSSYAINSENENKQYKNILDIVNEQTDENPNVPYFNENDGLDDIDLGKNIEIPKGDHLINTDKQQSNPIVEQSNVIPQDIMFSQDGYFNQMPQSNQNTNNIQIDPINQNNINPINSNNIDMQNSNYNIPNKTNYISKNLLVNGFPMNNPHSNYMNNNYYQMPHYNNNPNGNMNINNFFYPPKNQSHMPNYPMHNNVNPINTENPHPKNYDNNIYIGRGNLNSMTSNFNPMSKNIQNKKPKNKFESPSLPLNTQEYNMNMGTDIDIKQLNGFGNALGIKSLPKEKRLLHGNSSILEENEIFEKFGKRGWICVYCNNFNFESKSILILARMACNRCNRPKNSKKKYLIDQNFNSHQQINHKNFSMQGVNYIPQVHSNIHNNPNQYQYMPYDDKKYSIVTHNNYFINNGNTNITSNNIGYMGVPYPCHNTTGYTNNKPCNVVPYSEVMNPYRENCNWNKNMPDFPNKRENWNYE